MHPDRRAIGELAYRLWQSRGCPDGSAERDWLEAEKQLAGDPLPSAYEAPAAVATAMPKAAGPSVRLRDKSPRSRVPRPKAD